MALSDFVARFYSKVFIGIYESRRGVQVGVVVLARDGSQMQMEQTFAGGLGAEGIAFIQNHISRTPYNYIALLTDGASCGAVPTCSLSKAKEMAPAVAVSETVCIDDEWMNYCGEDELQAIQRRYESVQPDALYSPFALLHALYTEAMAGAHAIYILLTPEAMSLAVVKERHLRYAEHLVYGQTEVAPMLVERIVASLETYYGKPCCRGEFVESVYIADAAGFGDRVAGALEEALLIESDLRSVETALLGARTVMKERGYVL